MKKKILCLLLALAVVMSVLPLTAFASDVPEEYRGKYKGETTIDYEEHDVYMTVTVDEITISIPDYYFERSYSNKGNGSSYNIFGNDRNENIQMRFADNRATFRTEEFYGETALEILFIRKVSDSTNSTLSTGSNWIIPAAVGILALGAVIFIGKRKTKEETE